MISDFVSSLDPLYKDYVLARKDAKMSYRSAPSFLLLLYSSQA